MRSFRFCLTPEKKVEDLEEECLWKSQVSEESLALLFQSNTLTRILKGAVFGAYC